MTEIDEGRFAAVVATLAVDRRAQQQQQQQHGRHGRHQDGRGRGRAADKWGGTLRLLGPLDDDVAVALDVRDPVRFRGPDLLGCLATSLAVGDVVECSVVTSLRDRERICLRIVLANPADGIPQCRASSWGAAPTEELASAAAEAVVGAEAEGTATTSEQSIESNGTNTVTTSSSSSSSSVSSVSGLCRREEGRVVKVPGGAKNFGFLRCCERSDDVFFHLCEILPHPAAMRRHVEKLAASAAAGGNDVRNFGSPKGPRLEVGDEVSFQVIVDRGSNGRGGGEGGGSVRGRGGKSGQSGGSKRKLAAVRIWRLPRGTVSFSSTVEDEAWGIVRATPRRRGRDGAREVPGSIERIAAADIDAATATLAATALGDDGGMTLASADATAESVTAEMLGAASGQRVSKGVKDEAGTEAGGSGGIIVSMLSFATEDVNDPRTTVRVGDVVKFSLVASRRTGELSASAVAVVAAAPLDALRPGWIRAAVVDALTESGTDGLLGSLPSPTAAVQEDADTVNSKGEYLFFSSILLLLYSDL